MPLKPFKPPLLANRQSLTNIHATPEGPPPKRRRISDENEDSDVEATTAAAAKAAAVPKLLKTFVAHRVPLKDVGGTSSSQPRPVSRNDDPIGNESGQDAYYTVLWRKVSMRKNKTWDGDGVLSVSKGYARLQDIDGRDLGRTAWTTPLLSGSTLSLGGKEVEVDNVISKDDYRRGRPFLNGNKLEVKEPAPARKKSYLPPKRRPVSDDENANSSDFEKSIVRSDSALSSKFKKHALQRKPSDGTKHIEKKPMPRHDPNSPGAYVLTCLKTVPKGRQIVDIVVDPLLGRHLRPHQREGVKFMYECVMGMRESGEGAILADEMGLGKTLQTITLLWTLLKQNPIYEERPVAKKALIVCPVGLVDNWRKEFRKWLGIDRIGVLIVGNDKKQSIAGFTKGTTYSVLVIGYEKLRMKLEELKKGTPIDIIVADEGHRLKTAQNKSAQAIKELNVSRCIILSGTPIQNDLSEFFVAVDLVNPGLLGKYSTFKREFETPILNGRAPNATEKNKEKGEARNEELSRLTTQFMLRRTSDVIARFLPPKAEIILFLQPTAAQAALYNAVLESPRFNSILNSSEAYLQLILYLRKLCNSPKLLSKNMRDNSVSNSNVSSLLESLPPDRINAGHGAKITVLSQLLQQIKSTTDEKVVLVSNFTSTLDVLETLLGSLNLPFLRLDGSVAATKRQDLVDRFNKTSANNFFAFLLSAKAGGVGINLIGASRLVLFDVDWNPATDLQAMARIHRDGQKKHCFIYRFLVKGAMDEKIFQRQMTKSGLADSIVDAKKTGQHFTHEELRDLFRLDQSEDCQSSGFLDGIGFVEVSGDEDEVCVLEDEPLKACLRENDGDIAFVYAKTIS